MNTLATRSGTSSLQAQRLHSEFESWCSFALFVLDIVSFVAAAIVSDAFVNHDLNPDHLLHFFIYSSYIFVVFWILLFYSLGLYRQSLALSIRDEFYYSVAAIGVGIVPQLAIFTLVPRLSSSRLVLVLSALFAVAFVGISRSSMHALRKLLKSLEPHNVAVVGEAETVDKIVPNLGLGPNATVFRFDPQSSGDERYALEGLRSALRQARSVQCDTVLLTQLPPTYMISDLAETAAEYRIRLAFALPELCLSSSNVRLQRSGAQVLIETVQAPACTPRGKLVKRMTDLTLAVPLLVLALPWMLLAAAAIYFEDGLPIFYRQQRVGRYGKIFRIYKFRTMRTEQSSQSWAVRSDPRITKVGAVLRRFSIDELPQIFNVLRGEMSIVGPRPEMVSWARQFSEQFPRYEERHLVRPGITGWSQIYMKRVLEPSDVPDVLQHDLFYIEHWNLLLDLSVVCKTAFEFLFHRPA
jgi:exopolysaccharide biosynthesis polyprenyl glycosylphosphotransferase